MKRPASDGVTSKKSNMRDRPSRVGGPFQHLDIRRFGGSLLLGNLAISAIAAVLSILQWLRHQRLWPSNMEWRLAVSFSTILGLLKRTRLLSLNRYRLSLCRHCWNYVVHIGMSPQVHTVILLTRRPCPIQTWWRFTLLPGYKSYKDRLWVTLCVTGGGL